MTPRKCRCRTRAGGLKVRIRTREKAEAVAAKLIARDGSIRTHVYPCPAGEGWHVGHTRGLARDIATALRAGSAAAKATRTRRRRR